MEWMSAEAPWGNLRAV
jgi:hypothetical protein